MIEARQLEANRQIAEMQLAAYSGEELSGLRMVKTSPKERQVFDFSTSSRSLLIAMSTVPRLS
jgi:hypothetical protein